MNNLHRELAPVSDAAWAQIEEETSRTIKRYLAGRRVVDVQGPAGSALSAIGTGHQRTIAAPGDGIAPAVTRIAPVTGDEYVRPSHHTVTTTLPICWFDSR